MKKELQILALALLSLTACQPTIDKQIAPISTTKTTDNQPVAPQEIGLVKINFDDKTVLNFYAAPDEKSEKKTLEFFNDPAIDSWNIRNLEQQKQWLQPEILMLDNALFVLRCTAKKDGWYQVVVDNQSGQTLWLKNDALASFQDWETWLKNMFMVGRLPNHPQKIRQSADDNAPEIPYKSPDCFSVRAMQGDWIEIFSPEHCEEEKLKSGWIKWRNNNKLLIEYFPMS